jgi:peptidoglycan/LPS O-acetylase OafA/YrhL
MHQRSYKIFLSHLFVVDALLESSRVMGKPLTAVCVVFLHVIVVTGVLREFIPRFYSEPAKRESGRFFGDEAGPLDSHIQPTHDVTSPTGCCKVTFRFGVTETVLLLIRNDGCDAQ